MANYYKYLSRYRERSKATGGESQVWYESDLFFRVTLALVFILTTLLLFPRAESLKFAEYKEDSISREEIIAPFTFRVQKNAGELARERTAAERSVLPVFSRTDSTRIQSMARLTALRDSLTHIAQLNLPDSLAVERMSTLLNKNEVILTQELIPFFLPNYGIDPDSLVGRPEPATPSYRVFFAALEKILADIFAIGILDRDKNNIPNLYQERVLVLGTRGEEEKPLSACYDLAEGQQRLLVRLRSQFGSESDSVRVGYALLEPRLAPNLIFDPEETNRRKENALGQVAMIKGRFLSGERIVDNHERISEYQADALNSLAIEIRDREQKSGLLSQILIWLGEFLLIMSTQVPLALFLYFHRYRIWQDRRMMFIIVASMLFVVVISSLVIRYELSKFLIPFAIVPIIVTSYQDTRSGFFSGLSLSLLVGAQLGFDYELVMVGMVVSAASVVSFGFSKYRKRLVNATLILSVAYLLGIVAVGIIKYAGLDDLGRALLGALGAAIFSPILAYGFIMLFDAVFDVASEFKLIELSDLNNPLLKMISMRAPGSYHHSLQVSNLTEAAAEAIGANALLAKVGAYYHDIGKMFMPEYFVENQLDGKNPHDRLSPRLSSLILINHVRKGYEFARQNNVPSIVCDFILEHHGNSLMQFFYQKAKESAKDKDLEILESDFRYPGNRPKSRETGILMLADSVEAMVRSFKEPTLGKIQNAIRNLIREKIHSGELDDCPLTVSELATIVNTFSNILMGVHHGRIEYPNQKKMMSKPSRVMLVEG